ncbi:FAD:protein FMN transferase [Anaerolentibacter hominis]|uniref:FAD:protein FMN transferase n=1 Tax=Anaerolentibacter hominis TaxID=3079009 RepID=UPI0031B80B30
MKARFKKNFPLYIAILLLFVSLFYLGIRKIVYPDPVTGNAFVLNTACSITLYASENHRLDEQLIEQSFDLCRYYERIFSRTMEGSELFQVNNRKSDSVRLSADLEPLLSDALAYARLSGGAFNPAIGSVSSLWDFTSSSPHVPSQDQLREGLKHVDYQSLTIKDEKLTFSDPDTKLDLGAIAKGYIADRIKEFLIEHGITSAVINLGGNVLCIGDKKGEPFQIGIQAPFQNRNETIALMDLSDCSVVSSGIYERCFTQDGTFYHHILDPATGYPTDNNLVSVTIISEKSVDGDALSTACFVLGMEKGMALIDSLPDIYAVFITEDYELHCSAGFEQAVTVTDTR